MRFRASQALVASALCAAGTAGCGDAGSSAGHGKATLPPPTFAKTINLSPVRGMVSVKLPATSSFSRLAAPRQVPVGTVVRAGSGVVRLTAATGSPGHFDAGDFQGGTFALGQDRADPGVTELRIVNDQPISRACGAAHDSRVFGRLLGDAHGHFRTRGRSSVSTVRGTAWGVRNRCDGTLTIVRRGVVVVTDLRLHKDVVLRAGQRFLVKAR